MNTSQDTIRRHIGELGAMAAQTERAERQILAKAEEMLVEVEKRIASGRAAAQSDDEASKQYQADVLERGRLGRVILQAKQVLGTE